MKKTTKKLISLAVAVVMIVASLAGCQSNETVDASTLVIGGIGPLTGAAATYGIAVKNGAQIAVDEINAAGGINGMQIKFEFQDDEHDAEKAVNAYNTLKDKGMKILMGTVTSAPCTAVSAETAKDNMFQLTPSGSAVECTKGPNAFRVCFNDPNQGAASAVYIADNNLAKKVAVIYDSSDVYSTGIYKKFDAEAKVKGLEIVTAQAFTKDTSTDFSVQIQKIKESGAELVFLPIYYQAAALILTQADKAGLKTTFFGCDGLDGIIEQMGSEVALTEGVVLLTPFVATATDDKTVNFVNTYKEKFNEVPIQFAADAYDAMYIIKAAMEKAEIKDATMDMSEMCELLKTAMTQIELDGLTGEDMTWSADGEPNKQPKAMVIKNGVYEPMK